MHYEAEKPLHVCLPAYTVKTRIVRKRDPEEKKQMPVACLLPRTAGNTANLEKITFAVTFPGPVSLMGWTPDFGNQRYGEYEWPTMALQKSVEEGEWPILPSHKVIPLESKCLTCLQTGLQYADYVSHAVSAVHSGRSYFVKAYQDNAEDFARCRLYKEDGTNDTPVTWIFQILMGAPGAEVTLFSFKLCYDFHFAGHKAAQVGIHPSQFAVRSLQAQHQPHHRVSNYSSNTDNREESLHRRHLCVSQ